VRFAEATTSDEDDVGLLVHEAQAEQVFDLHFVDLGRPVPTKTIERFEDGEAGGADAPLQGAFLAPLVFSFEQMLQIVRIRPFLFGRLFGEWVVVFGELGQTQVIEIGVQRIHGWSDLGS